MKNQTIHFVIVTMALLLSWQVAQAQSSGYSYTSGYPASTEAELREAVTHDKGLVRLTDDITLTSSLNIASGKQVGIDLGGYTLSRGLDASAGDNGHVIKVEQGATLEIMSNETVRPHGYITGGYANQGGAIYNSGTLLIRLKVVITGNRAAQDGGGIFNTGTLTIQNCELTDNYAPNGGGGGIWSNGTATLQNVTVSSTTTSTAAAYNGGGLTNHGTMTLTGCTVTGNRVDGYGGGIYNNGSLEADGCTITGNYAFKEGGGIYMWSGGTYSTVSSVSTQLKGTTTITGNTTETWGGGFYADSGSLSMEGKVVLKDNNLNKNGVYQWPDNLYLYNTSAIEVTGNFQENTEVNLVSYYAGLPFTHNYGKYNQAPVNVYFTAESSSIYATTPKMVDDCVEGVFVIPYIERSWDATNKEVVSKQKLRFDFILASTLADDKSQLNLPDGTWLVADRHMQTFDDNRLMVNGTLNIILGNGVQLNMNRGIGVNQGNTLNIYGQQGDKGILHTQGYYNGYAAIGSEDDVSAGTINLYGGRVTAIGADYAAGIGGGDNSRFADNGGFTMYGGYLYASSESEGAGIGSGNEPEGSDYAGRITFYGGEVDAYGSKYGTAIGGGDEGKGAQVYVWGGHIKAYGYQGTSSGSAGIGGGYDADGGYVEVNGGKVEAQGGFNGAAIGNAAGINVKGKSSGTLKVTGGEVIATGYKNSCAIGASCYSRDVHIEITGGTVIAQAYPDGTGQRAMGISDYYMGWNYYETADIKMANNMRVYAGSDKDNNSLVGPSDRVSAPQNNKYCKVEVCTHENSMLDPNHQPDNDKHYFTCANCLAGNELDVEHTIVGGHCSVCGHGKTADLADNEDNSTLISSLQNITVAETTLSGRTLYKDGYWNTLCLPFTVELESSPLAGATVKTLTEAEVTDGTLSLYFTDVKPAYTDEKGTHTFLQPGTPYLLKWDSGTKIENPVFGYRYYNSTAPQDVVISNIVYPDAATDEEGSSSEPTYEPILSFKGTYAPVTLEGGNGSLLYLGANNTLYYPKTDVTINAFRAYFQLNSKYSLQSANAVRRFVLSLGDDSEATTVTPTDLMDYTHKTGEWHDLQGRKISGKPTQRGIYISNGQKVVIK